MCMCCGANKIDCYASQQSAALCFSAENPGSKVLGIHSSYNLAYVQLSGLLLWKMKIMFRDWICLFVDLKSIFNSLWPAIITSTAWTGDRATIQTQHFSRDITETIRKGKLHVFQQREVFIFPELLEKSLWSKKKKTICWDLKVSHAQGCFYDATKNVTSLTKANSGIIFGRFIWFQVLRPNTLSPWTQ